MKLFLSNNFWLEARTLVDGRTVGRTVGRTESVHPVALSKMQLRGFFLHRLFARFPVPVIEVHGEDSIHLFLLLFHLQKIVETFSLHFSFP